ncbi:unnamed protein product [marine sediment metagenome]|uniref:Uncharacterized protein n=1 Tax=marine sediment metagenome TaxID=412755 RepID=X1UPS7_9ZZZZ
MKGKRFRIKGNSDYFREKYGTPNPIIEIEAEDVALWPGGWKVSNATVCKIYGKRNGLELLPINGKVYYGYIECAPPTPDSSSISLGELVHKGELEPYEGPLTLPSSRNITFENSDPVLNEGIEVRTMIMSRLEGQVCGFCGKPGDDERPLKVWFSPYNDTRWFYHDPCLWDEMERDELEEQEKDS